MSNFRCLIGAIACLGSVIGGCASTTAIPVSPYDTTTPGIRYFEKKPILMVYNKGAIIEYVGNPNRAYALQFTAFLAKNDIKTKFSNGGLDSLDTNMDSTEIIKLLTTIASGLLGTPATPKASAGDVGLGPLRAVYDFEFSDAGEFVRLRRMDPGFPKPLPEAAIVPAPAGGTGTGAGKSAGPIVGDQS